MQTYIINYSNQANFIPIKRSEVDELDHILSSNVSIEDKIQFSEIFLRHSPPCQKLLYYWINLLKFIFKNCEGNDTEKYATNVMSHILAYIQNHPYETNNIIDVAFHFSFYIIYPNWFVEIIYPISINNNINHYLFSRPDFVRNLKSLKSIHCDNEFINDISIYIYSKFLLKEKIRNALYYQNDILFFFKDYLMNVDEKYNEKTINSIIESLRRIKLFLNGYRVINMLKNELKIIHLKIDINDLIS